MLVRLTRALVVACALLTALPAGAAAEFTREPQKVYDDYRSDAAIEPCDHTVAVYRRTLKQITPDVEEETPAFRPAVEAALRERGRGKRGCLEGDSPTQPGTTDGGAAGGTNGGSNTTPSPPVQTVPPASTPAPVPPATNVPAPADGGAGGSAPSAPATPTPTVAPAPPVADSAPPAATAPTLLNRPHKGTPTGLLIALGLVALSALLALLALLARRLGWGEERLAGPRHAWGEATYRASATWADFLDWIRLGRGPQRL